MAGIRTGVRALALLATGPAIAAAQLVSPTMSDATVVSPGALRFRGHIEWSRFDAVFGPGGKSTFPIGSLLTTELDVPALPLLGQTEIDVRTLTNDPGLAISLGTLRTSADSRIVSVPLGFEYGLTSRLSVGITIPIVQSRTIIVSQLNARGDSTANLGVNPGGYFLSPSAFAANSQVTSALENALQQLEARRQQCAGSPLSAGCPAFNSRAPEAEALVDAAAAFADAAIAVYGVSGDSPGSLFAPVAGGAVQQAVDARLAELRAAFASFGISAGTGNLLPAQGFAANAQLQSLVSDPSIGIGLDSIGSTEMTSVGDIELSLAARLFDSFGATDERSVRLRGALMGVVRLGTGHPARANRPFEVPTGDGQTDLELRGAVDAMIGRRWLTTAAGTVTMQLGSVSTERLPYPPDLIFALDYPVAGSVALGPMASAMVNPRFLITPALMIGGIASMSYRGADDVTVTGLARPGAEFGNQSRQSYSAGLTLSYSNLATATGMGRASFPAEVFFSHVETLGASTAGVEKLYRSSIELRYYFRTRR